MLRSRATNMAKSFQFTFKNLKFPVRLPAESVGIDERVLASFAPFNNWVREIEQSVASTSGYKLRGVDIQSVDYFGSRIGFLKFRADLVHPNGHALPGVTVLRGGSVAMLVVIRDTDSPAANNGTPKEYIVLTDQPRVPLGRASYLEIPAGMIDEQPGADQASIFVGAAARELQEEVGISITRPDELVDLTHTVAHAPDGVHLSPGLLDEAIKIYLHTTALPASKIAELQGQLRSRVEESGENEVITLRIVPLEQALLSGLTDAKSILALSLYTQYKTAP